MPHSKASLLVKTLLCSVCLFQKQICLPVLTIKQYFTQLSRLVLHQIILMFPTCKDQAKKPQILKFTGILIEEIILAFARSLYSNLCLLSSLPPNSTSCRKSRHFIGCQNSVSTLGKTEINGLLAFQELIVEIVKDSVRNLTNRTVTNSM